MIPYTYIIQREKSNTRKYATNPNLMKVSVIGASGKVGQGLCLMLKQSPLIDELCLHDVKHTSGLAKELEHIDTQCKITNFTGNDNVAKALEYSKVVIVLAAGEDTDVLPFDRMWSLNALIVKSIAFLVIATNPINSLVPLACEVLKKGGCYNPKTVFGVTTLDTVRANTFVAEVQGIEPECVVVPVIGGHTEETMVPVLSQAKPCSDFTNEELENITTSIRKAHENILKLKPSDSAPLSAAFAIARFIISLVKAIRGYPDITECAYVHSKAHPQLKSQWHKKNLGIPKLTDYESCMLDNAIPILIKEIKRGEKFAGVIQPPPCDICDPNPNAPRCPTNWCEQKPH
ncbi:hypothetical protein NQ317_000851 [Molorchus minor]|uniref:Malate dehydrogenase n=1 Tax=Molorchus minor TaxID=1323400 RepID=A0ABQ9JW95_9CUCU|nr:hypothetical protein NQ317_000851 [Molorchus minor]